MSKRQLKSHLVTLSKEQLTEHILELYTILKPVKEYYDFYLNPNEKEMSEKYKTIIVNEFYPGGKYTEPKTRFSVAKKAIADFRNLKPSPMLIGDLMVTLVEMACKFTYDYGDMWEQYYDSTANNFERALQYLQKNGLLKDFEKRINKCLTYAEPCGYGFPDDLNQVFCEYYG